MRASIVNPKRLRMPALRRPSTILTLLLVTSAAQAGEVRRYERSEKLMGVEFKFVLYAEGEEAANRAADAALSRVAELDAVMSDYQADSELNRLSRTAGSGESVPVSDDLWQVLSRSQQLSRRTGGAFDVTVGPLVKHWRRARRSGKMPELDRLREARESVGYRFLRLDAKRQSVELTRPNMRLDLGAIAKGYAADAALAVLAEHDICRAMVDASGDLAVGAPPPGEPGWRIGIARLSPEGPPSRFLLLKNAAVATSGDAFQFVEIDGKRYSHIIDPRTGLGLTTRSSVTVVAPAGVTADSLASAVSVLGPGDGLELIAQTPKAEALIVVRTGGKTQAYASPGMEELLEPAADGGDAGRRRGGRSFLTE